MVTGDDDGGDDHDDDGDDGHDGDDGDENGDDDGDDLNQPICTPQEQKRLLRFFPPLQGHVNCCPVHLILKCSWRCWRAVVSPAANLP